jgi:hypothetical protein
MLTDLLNRTGETSTTRDAQTDAPSGASSMHWVVDSSLPEPSYTAFFGGWVLSFLVFYAVLARILRAGKK